MTSNTVAPPELELSFPRVLGRYEGNARGPTLLIIGGVHGNEPSGAYAAQAVLRALVEGRRPMRGRVVGLAGNLAALAARRRYLAVDLNRLWQRSSVRLLRQRDPATDGPEEAEQRALLELIDGARADADDGLVVLDLHTTSGAGPPFSLMSDTIRNRRVALSLPVPMILGLEESIDGTLLEYLTQQGDTAVVVEGGQHDDPGSIANHEAVIWNALVSIGCVRVDDVPDRARHRRTLDEAAKGLPRVVELRYRHPVHPGDAFKMEPGFQGLQQVQKGQLLARDRHGEVRALANGRLLMPLYQPVGSDGFFLVSKVSLFWLALSSLLRRLRVDRTLHWLPGIRPDEAEPGALRVDRRVARWLVVEIFHLLGFRRRRQDGEQFVFSRRPG